MLPDGKNENQPATDALGRPSNLVDPDKGSANRVTTEIVHDNITDAGLHIDQSASDQKEKCGAAPAGRVAPAESSKTDSPAAPVKAPDVEALDFDDLIVPGFEEAGSASFLSPFFDELKKPILGIPSLDSFTGFETGGFTPTTGEYSFVLKHAELQRLMAVLRCTFESLPKDGLIKLSVSRSLLSAQAYAFGAFSETL